QSGLPLSMARVSTPLETATTFALAGDRRGSGLLRRYLGWRGQGPDRCLVIVGLSGHPDIVGATARAVDDLVRGSHGVAAPGVGPAWRRSRFSAPYLRNALWEEGYAVDTLETATDWTTLPALATDLAQVLRHGLEPAGERVHAFSHLSHPYGTGSSLYTSYVFRLAGDPDATLERWRTLKSAASEVIVRHGATISHQHGVGTDHAPYLAAEKGPLGMRTIETLVREFDPDGVMHRGVLLEDRSR
ncbi:MAG TPA: FAD-linked oxidase C-terminal domain-containing protein, partial [Candidatus Limnocylindrales bacterium]